MTANGVIGPATPRVPSENRVVCYDLFNKSVRVSTVHFFSKSSNILLSIRANWPLKDLKQLGISQWITEYSADLIP